MCLSTLQSPDQAWRIRISHIARDTLARSWNRRQSSPHTHFLLSARSISLQNRPNIDPQTVLWLVKPWQFLQPTPNSASPTFSGDVLSSGVNLLPTSKYFYSKQITGLWSMLRLLREKPKIGHHRWDVTRKSAKSLQLICQLHLLFSIDEYLSRIESSRAYLSNFVWFGPEPQKCYSFMTHSNCWK